MCLERLRNFCCEEVNRSLQPSSFQPASTITSTDDINTNIINESIRIKPSAIRNVIIFGNHSASQVPYLHAASVRRTTVGGVEVVEEPLTVCLEKLPEIVSVYYYLHCISFILIFSILIIYVSYILYILLTVHICTCI